VRKKTFRAQAEQDFKLVTLEAIPEERKGFREGTRLLPGARLIAIDRLKPDPDQPRKTSSKENLQELAASIKAHGILQPLTVEYVEEGDHFKIINGERRYRAALLAGLKEVPCWVKEVKRDDRLLQQLIENLQRETLHPLEEAEGLQVLIERYGYQQKDLVEKLGKSKATISETLSLLRLPEDLKAEVRTSELASKSLLLQIVRQPTAAKMYALWERAKQGGLTVREARGKASKGRPKLKRYQFRYKPEGGDYKVLVTFNRPKVTSEEVVAALRKALTEAEASHGD